MKSSYAIRVELPSWSGHGTLFTRLDKYRFSFILLTLNLFRHPTLVEHILYLLLLQLFM